MAEIKKRSYGCWTCRLRRKYCDEARPECEACGSLEIQCYYGGQRSECMDGGMRQKAQPERIKAQIRRSANHRCEIHVARSKTAKMTDQTFIFLASSREYTSDVPPGLLGQQNATSDLLTNPSTGPDYEIVLLTRYLDFVFPFLFAFYQPPVFEIYSLTCS